MGLIRRSTRAVVIGTAGLAITGLSGAFTASAARAAAPSATPSFTSLRDSVPASANARTGQFTSSLMSVQVMLAPQHQAQLNGLLAAVYNPGSAGYRHWLARGQFDTRFAPSAAKRAAVARYLRARGLQVAPTASPFLMRATGSSRQVSAAFRTSLSTYQDRHGVRYFANSSAVRMPSTLAGGVLGVIGLTNTVRAHPMIARARGIVRPSGKPAASSASSASCETGYPTRKQLFNRVNNGVSFPSGYGGGPACSGLTPSQTNSIYGAPRAGRRGQGAGVTLGLFELSAYQPSDIATYAHRFFGPGYTPPLANVIVDGGPLHPACPSGDTCPPDFNGYSGDIEVDADIETQLSVAPDVSRIIVYNAPNDETGQTVLDEYTRIAHDDLASSVSSSWGICESDIGAAYAEAENVIFEQMALQGQSMFASSGDSGAFDCIDADGSTRVNVNDPSAQPWVTSVGGTSLESDNPGTRPHPAYRTGVETVWNPDNLCHSSASEGGNSGFFWCSASGVGAGGGGSSQFWGRPFYQRGRGVSNPFTTVGNSTTHCVLAAQGTPCREMPDISANADEWTPYAEFCTGSASTPESTCATFSGSQPAPGWFGIGGTSLSTPLWSAIIADRDSYQRHRSGNINPLLYQLFRAHPNRYFHDITGVGPKQQAATSNGRFPTRPGYDEATGIGTPKMAALITSG
jgi:subtilase family serine protease